MKQVYYSIFTLVIVGIFLYTGCSRSGRKNIVNKNNNLVLTQGNPAQPTENNTSVKTSKSVVKMKKANGVYEIPTEINGVPMHFIFDTGAGLISISETEINLLREQGKFSYQDVVGTGNFMDANGDITEGTIVLLKTVKIGDRILNNIEASVVHNLTAPLLMGQSALEKFGRISIDYKNEEITFE